MKSIHERTGLEDALDKQVSKSNLLCVCIAQFIESLRRNPLGPGSNPAQPRKTGCSFWLMCNLRRTDHKNIATSLDCVVPGVCSV